MGDHDRIFISYAGPDVDHAVELRQALEARGHRAFVDTENLNPGDPWDTTITAALREAGTIVVIVSAEWTHSDRWYAHDEVARAVFRARHEQTRIIPAIIGGVSPLDMPSGLARLIPLTDVARDWQATAATISAIVRGEATGQQPGDRVDREALALADLAVAQRHLDAAVAGLRRSGTQHHIPRGLLACAAYHRAAADLDAAAADLAEARAIAARGGMRLYLTDCDLEAARFALARGDRAAAERFYIAARDAVRDIRYHRRDPELEALANALGLTPPDWLHQADVEVELPPDPPPQPKDGG